MRFTREQKRWMRRHRGLLIISGIFGVVLVVALLYCGLLLTGKVGLPEFLGGKNISFEIPTFAIEQKTTEAQNTNVLTPNPVLLTAPQEKAEIVYTPKEGIAHPYYVKVNRVMNCVTIYGMDDAGAYTIPVKAMVCSVGKEGQETPVAISKTSNMYEFHPMVDGSYAQFAYRFNVGGILFHSVPYHTKDKADLETDQFNLLGSAASLGCVRVCVRDALWLQQNCPEGTTVEVFDDPTTPGPLGKPDMIKIPMDSPYAGWDPTDPDENNPWKNCFAVIEGATNKTIKAGEVFVATYGVTAKDTCGNDITDRIVIQGMFDCNTPGTYELNYTVKDLIGSKAEVKRILTVTE